MALTVGALLAARGVVGSGVLRSSMLLPLHDSLGDLWRAAATAPEGVTPPAWLGQLSVIATVTLGRPSLATDLLLLAVVPLSAWSAWSFLRRIVLNRSARAWGASAYGLAVVAGGAVQQGRTGTCVAALVLPLLAIALHTILRRRRAATQGSWRAAWFAGAVLALLVAFTPALAALLLLGIVVAGVVVARRNRRQGNQLFFAAALGPLLVLPWTIELVRHPSRLGQEAGGTPTTAAGPGDSVPHLVTAVPDALGTLWFLAVPLVLVALLSLVRGSRQRFELAGWAVAVAGLLATLLSSRLGGGSGPLMFLTTVAWISVVTVAWGSARRETAPLMRGAIGLVLAATVATGGWWLIRGDDGPLRRSRRRTCRRTWSPPRSHRRTRPSSCCAAPDGGSRYAIVRDGGPRMGAIEAEAPAAANRQITEVLSALGGGGVGDEAARLERLGVDYVYLAPPVDPTLVATMDTVSGLNRSSAEEAARPGWSTYRRAGPRSRPTSPTTAGGWPGSLPGWSRWSSGLPTARRSVGGTHGTHARRASS